MIFRRMITDAGENQAEGYFLSRGLFFLLLILCCFLGMLFAALFVGLNSRSEEQKKTHGSVGMITLAQETPVSSSLPIQEAVPGLNQQLINLFSQGKYEEVVMITASLSFSLPGAETLQPLMIHSLVKLGRLAEADYAISAALKAFAGNHELLLAAASFYQSTGNPLVAEKMLLKAIAANPGKVGAVRGLVAAYLQAGLLEVSRDSAVSGLQKFPDDPGLTLGLADSLRLLGDYSGAIKNYQKYLRLVPVAGADTHYYLGQCFLKSGADRELVFAQFAQALRVRPSHIPTLNDYGLLLATSARASEAVELIPALLEHSKEAAFALDTAGLIQLMAGHSQLAEPLMLRAHTAEPENSEFSAHLSSLYSLKKEQAKAEEYKNKALAGCRGDRVLLKRTLDELKAYQP